MGLANLQDLVSLGDSLAVRQRDSISARERNSFMKLFAAKLSVAIGVGAIAVAGAAPAGAVSLTLRNVLGDPMGNPEQPQNFLLPQGVDIQPGTENIYISDSGKSRVAVFDRAGNYLFDFGQEFIDESADLEFNDTTGEILVGDVNNNEIDVFTPQGEYIRSFGEFTIGTERPFEGPGGVAFSPDFDLFYVNDYAADRILAFDPESGEQVDVIGQPPEDFSDVRPGELFGPSGISVSEAGHLYITEQLSSRVQVFSPQGESLQIVGNPKPRDILDPFAPVPEDIEPGDLSGPVAMEVDRFGNMYVSDTLNNRVQVFNPEGEVVTVVDEIDAVPPNFIWTVGAQFEDDTLYATDFLNNRVAIFDVTGNDPTTAEPIPEPTTIVGTLLFGLGGAWTKWRQRRC